MHIVFHASEKEREQRLAQSFIAGARAFGHTGQIAALTDRRLPLCADLACMVGVKSKALWDSCRAAGQKTMMFDKGYDRSKSSGAWNYWRVSLGAHHPTQTTLMKRPMPMDRLEAVGWNPRAWRRAGRLVIFAGSSAKYHQFCELPHPTIYAARVIADVRHRTKLRIVYRPKPSWRDATPIGGTAFSSRQSSFADLLDNAALLITHGSNACLDAMLAGVPTITLGDGVAAAIGNRTLDEIPTPAHPERTQWLANLAYHQWSCAEFESGEAWATIERWF